MFAQKVDMEDDRNSSKQLMGGRTGLWNGKQ